MSGQNARERAALGFQQCIQNSGWSELGGTESYMNLDELAYLLSKVPFLTPRPVRIACVGAGLSGLALAHAVETGKLKSVDLTIYEKNADIGGTWYENRYPGCACDIPSHNYQFSWAPNPFWKSFYADRNDILKYVNAVADQNDLRKYVKTCHKVVGAKWNQEKQAWSVRIVETDHREIASSSKGVAEGETPNQQTADYDILINASGFFNDWKWPSVPGREDFKGKLLHSAAWPAVGDACVDGKVVALIGNGSSGVQILPAIINRVEKVYVYTRSATWVTTPLAEKFAGPGGSNIIFTEEQKVRWEEHPEEYLAYRKEVEKVMNERFRLYMAGSETQKKAYEFSSNQMKEKLINGGKSELADLLLPKFEVGCRRPTPGNGYLEALCSPKCEVIWGDVEAFTPTGLKSSSGKDRCVDTIICATGFNLSCAPRFPIIGLKGVNLQHKWQKEDPQAYLSVTAANMPNYFTVMGPASPLGHGSLVTSIEFVITYISDLIRKLQTQNYSSLVPKGHVPAAYQKQALAWLDRTVWAAGCSSTYKNGTVDGKLISLHPGSRLHYFKLLSTPRYEDFEWTSLSSEHDMTFAWLGNGFTEEEEQSKEWDSTYFLNPDKYTKAIHR